MITDLMRNDLSRVCRPGSVRVRGTAQRATASRGLASGVDGPRDVDRADQDGRSAGRHLSSGVGDRRPEAGRPARDRRARDGATRRLHRQHRAGQPVRRDRPQRDHPQLRDTTAADPRIELGVGGGITTDSVPIREWYECLHKAAPLVAAARRRARSDAGRSSPNRPPPSYWRPACSSRCWSARAHRPTGRALGPAGPVLPGALRCRPAGRSRRPAATAKTISIRRSGSRCGSRCGRWTVDWRSPPYGRWAAAGEPAPCGAGNGRFGRGGTSGWTGRRWRRPRRGRWGDAVLHVRRCGDRDLARQPLLAGRDGIWRTPPLDEQVLPGVTRREVVEQLGHRGIPCESEWDRWPTCTPRPGCSGPAA